MHLLVVSSPPAPDPQSRRPRDWSQSCPSLVGSTSASYTRAETRIWSGRETSLCLRCLMHEVVVADHDLDRLFLQTEEQFVRRLLPSIPRLESGVQDDDADVRASGS